MPMSILETQNCLFVNFYNVIFVNINDKMYPVFIYFI